jgi:acyl carrier protein
VSPTRVKKGEGRAYGTPDTISYAENVIGWDSLSATSIILRLDIELNTELKTGKLGTVK